MYRTCRRLIKNTSSLSFVEWTFMVIYYTNSLLSHSLLILVDDHHSRIEDPQ